MNVTAFPLPRRREEKGSLGHPGTTPDQPARAPALPVEQSNVGTYGYPLIDITPGPDGYRVWVGGWVYHSCRTDTNAMRVASLLNDLAKLGALPSRPSVREMLEASVEQIGGT